MVSQVRFQAQQTIDYPNIVQRGAADTMHSILETHVPDVNSFAIVTDATVGPLYAEGLAKNLEAITTKPIPVLTFPAGETSKTIETLHKLVGELVDNGVHRRSALIALGGGVVIDTVGFVAASFMRGVDYINVPTSLIAQADAGIGGKVAVNHSVCKNLIGGFWHPRAVVIDPDYLHSLPVDEIRNGLAEIVKVAVIHSQPLFERMEQASSSLVDRIGTDRSCDTILEDVVRMKIELLLPDPFESDLRRVLNFGHSFAHPLEVTEGYRLRHGYAVSVGMCLATTIALQRKMIKNDQAERIFTLLGSFGLPRRGPPVDPDVLWGNVNPIRQVRANKLHYVVPCEIGQVKFIDDLTFDEFSQAFNSLAEQFDS